MTHRWKDDAGHEWPLTADWCTVCGLPLIVVDHHTTHPNCDPRKDHT